MFLKEIVPGILNLLGILGVVLSLFVIKDQCTSTIVWVSAFVAFLIANIIDWIIGTPQRTLPHWAMIIVDLSVIFMALPKLLEQCF